MKARNLLARVCLSVLAGVAVMANEGAAAQTPAAGPRATLTSQAGSIAGTVLDGLDQPIPAARLRLRDLTRGRIVMTTRGDEQGRFQFSGVPSGQYVVEFVDEGGSVRALGQTFTVTPGETVATFIRLGARVPWYKGFFANAATAAVSSAAGLGVTAVGSGGQPASARF